MELDNQRCIVYFKKSRGIRLTIHPSLELGSQYLYTDTEDRSNELLNLKY